MGTRDAKRAWSGARRLADGETIPFRPGGERIVLRCLAGTLLVTQAGDPADHVLGPGDELCVTGRGLVVAWALSEASLDASPMPRAQRRAA